MVPTPQSRIVEMLDSIRGEFDQLAQELYICKTQRDDFEHKMNQQIADMNSFQQNLLEMERNQQSQKKQFEDEIARLRQQIEARGGHTSVIHPPPQPPQPPQKLKQPTPPNIGPGSNYFGGIMNNHGNQGPPGLVAPPQMEQPPAGYPATPPTTTVFNNPPSYTASPGRGMPTPPVSGHPRPDWAFSYPRPASNPPDAVKRKPTIPPHNTRPAKPITSTPSTLADMDPDNVPANMKVEGSDWFALFNPKAPRLLKVDLLHTLDQNSVVCCVKFSADGRYLAAGCNRATYIYDVATSQRVAVLQDESIKIEGDLYIRSVCFSPDGNYLATGAEDMQIRIWDIQNKRIRHVLMGHVQDIYSLDFSRDGRMIASGSGDCTARIWNMADGKCLQILRITDHDQKDPGVTSVAFSPDGRIIAAASLDKMVRIWDTQTGVLFERLEGHKDSVYSVAFMPDGKMLVSGSLDKTLKLWQLGTNEGRGMGIDRDRSKGPCKMTFTGHKDFVLSVGCTPDGRWVVSGSKDRGVQFWDPRTGQTQFMLQGHKNSVISVAISPSGRPLFATGSGDNRARIWSYDSINA